MKRFIADVKKYYKYAIRSAKSELKAEVANSYLNWLWWVLDPLCFMLIYVFIFGFVFGASEPYFAVFIFIGITLWDFFSRSINTSIKMVKNNKAIVSKVYLPKFILVMVKMMVNAFKMSISLVIILIMMVISRVPFTWSILWFFPILLIFILLSFGCACHLLHYGVFVEDLSNVITIVLRLLFYMTGIFYDVEGRIKGAAGYYLARLNPLAYLMKSMRNALLYGLNPNALALLGWLLISLIICITGIRKIYKNENSYVKVI